MRRITRAAAGALIGALVAAVLAPPAFATPAPRSGPAMLRQAAACGPSFRGQLTKKPWPLERLHPEVVWPLSRGRGVTVAVIDSGVSTAHPKLANRVLPGIDYVTPGASTGDCDADGHGTLVAGIIAGAESTDSPFYGVAPDANILPIRVLLNRNPSADPNLSKRIADGINYAVLRGARVINLSLFTPNTPELAAAVKAAWDKGVVLIAAAGNEGRNLRPGEAPYPGAYEEVIAVAGVDPNGVRVASSNAGGFVDVAAPGLAIEGPAPQGGGYAVDLEGGTSFAAAYVSGVAALIRSKYPEMGAGEVKRRLLLTADAPPEGRNAEIGFGVVNPYQAVASVLDTTDATAPIVTAPLPRLNPPDPGPARLRLIAIVAGLSSLLVAFIFVGVVPFVRRRLRGPGAMPDPWAGLSSRPASGPLPSTPEVSMGPVVISSPSVRR